MSTPILSLRFCSALLRFFFRPVTLQRPVTVAELGPELAHHRCGQPGQPYRPDTRRDVQVEVAPVLGERRTPIPMTVLSVSVRSLHTGAMPRSFRSRR
jgi:hypothetical protein